MQSIQRLGGMGALIAAGTFVVGLVMFATIFMDFVSATDPAAAVDFIVDHQLALHVWNIAIHIVMTDYHTCSVDRPGDIETVSKIISGKTRVKGQIK